ncbi:MAG: hypothetical protein V5A88_03525 [Candidatus Thermoplasmatota archaeon]
MVKSISLDSISGPKDILLPKKEGESLLYYLIMALIIFPMAVGIILVGGMLRLTLANLILFIIGFNLVYWSMEITEKSDVWKSEEEFDERVNLKLKGDSELVKRACKGMELSRGILEKKIKNLYLSKLMENRNLEKEKVGELLKNSEEFRQVVDDDIISDFILSKRGENESERVDEEENLEEERSSTKQFEGEEYKRWISKLLKRIEGWE